ncbi:MAG TPA: lmo0937 family membrane protein [Candidatus Woesebacteria bacterium]|nr:lmo0937 family membrane protein [Candidatus Woesebacteria bacterium]
MLDIIIIILVIAWLGGFSLKIGGGLIHVILVIALIVLVARLLGVRI